MKKSLLKLVVTCAPLIVGSLANATTIICGTKDAFGTEGAIVLNLSNSDSASLELSIFDRKEDVQRENPLQNEIKKMEELLKRPDLKPEMVELINKRIDQMKSFSLSSPQFSTTTTNVIASSSDSIEFLSEDVELAKRFAATRSSVVSTTQISITNLDSVEVNLLLTVPSQVTAKTSFNCLKQ